MKVRIDTVEVGEQAKKALCSQLGVESMKRPEISEYLFGYVTAHVDDLAKEGLKAERARIEAALAELENEEPPEDF